MQLDAWKQGGLLLVGDAGKRWRNIFHVMPIMFGTACIGDSPTYIWIHFRLILEGHMLGTELQSQVYRVIETPPDLSVCMDRIAVFMGNRWRR